MRRRTRRAERSRSTARPTRGGQEALCTCVTVGGLPRPLIGMTVHRTAAWACRSSRPLAPVAGHPAIAVEPDGDRANLRPGWRAVVWLGKRSTTRSRLMISSSMLAADRDGACVTWEQPPARRLMSAPDSGARIFDGGVASAWGGGEEHLADTGVLEPHARSNAFPSRITENSHRFV